MDSGAPAAATMIAFLAIKHRIGEDLNSESMQASNLVEVS